MDPPYLQEFAKISGFTVWIVDGTHIRNNIDIEFTNFGQHYVYDFIPESEFWIDQEHSPGEVELFVTHLLVEHKLMKEGKSYEEAVEAADFVELEARNKTPKIMKLGKKAMDRDEVLKKVHKELYSEYGELKVWIVDGELVRSAIYINFTEGGHDKVYPFVPENEIWIDDDLSRDEMKFVLLHELYERNLMVKNWSYYVEEEEQLKHRRGNRFKSAHTAASALESLCRQNPQILDAQLSEEIEKATKNYPLVMARK
jgi:hypothetical protein